jgi:hypothetical protein
MSLTQLDKYVTQNKRLPGVASAEEVGSQGQDIGAGQAALLKKVEELTLYVIQLNNEMNHLNKKMERLTKENKQLKKNPKLCNKR